MYAMLSNVYHTNNSLLMICVHQCLWHNLLPVSCCIFYNVRHSNSFKYYTAYRAMPVTQSVSTVLLCIQKNLSFKHFEMLFCIYNDSCRTIYVVMLYLQKCLPYELYQTVRYTVSTLCRACTQQRVSLFLCCIYS